MTFKEFYTRQIEQLIAEKVNVSTGKIFVLTDTNLLSERSELRTHITDPATFEKHGDELVFTSDWFTRIFSNLNVPDSYHLLSAAQFSYLIHYIKADFFKNRAILLHDNLRQLYPIPKESYCEKSDGQNSEARPENLPIYQAEQIKIGENHYYSLRQFDETFEKIDIFREHTALEDSPEDESLQVIDVGSDTYALDEFVNACIASNDFTRFVSVKLFSKQPVSDYVKDQLECLNGLLQQFGGQLYRLEQSTIRRDFTPKPETLDLLKRFWGSTASFKSLKVYKNPDLNNELVEISQGIIVETIINEYEKSKEDSGTRDLFLTAPTGAGKSLLFQLPAFHIAEKGDVTIVISPLISLMKDQVEGIQQERKFEPVAYLNSELSLLEREGVLKKCHDGKIDILYMSPELFLSYDISYFLGERRLGLLVVDEAHLITTWGRDFRVDYWFLGNHIRKIRKYKKYEFPMVAVTATAVYGGSNDMVFDGVKSLEMKNEHLFIGQVKRDDIQFAVNNYEEFEKDYRKRKLAQTVAFIKKAHDLGMKTLVYTPYSRHIRELLSTLRAESLDIANGYFGSMSGDEKQLAYTQFKTGVKKVMISTKAFGMGVDISDIEVVYHHAPSGLLPDYIQEIGRVARKPEIKGVAALNYSSKDQQFSKALHGMSALRHYQLKEVLKKIHKLYKKQKDKRNLLVSVDDFGHIFDKAENLDQKVLTSLMMLEKDYLAKYRFNVLVARPKSLFVKVYALIEKEEYHAFEASYKEFFKVKTTRIKSGSKIVEIDLDKLWNKRFNEKSFPSIKYDFYQEKLFQKDNIKVIPQLQISFEKQDSFQNVFNKLNTTFETLKRVFNELEGFFTEDDFKQKLNAYINDRTTTNKLAKFVLSTFSGYQIQPGVIEPNAFLQQKRTLGGYKYRIAQKDYGVNFSKLLRTFRNLFVEDLSTASRYVSAKDSKHLIKLIRLGYFLEVLDLGSYESKGGDKPMLFIRLNDPLRIERDGNAENYRNTLLKQTHERHYLSNQIFDHFFMKRFSNEERWNFIEDFFLGEEVDTLIEKYPGSDSEQEDMFSVIEKCKNDSEALPQVHSKETLHCFAPKSGKFYEGSDSISLDTAEGPDTMRISQWIRKHPVLFHKAIRKQNFRIDRRMYQILLSKLQTHHPEYIKKLYGLKIKIKPKGYSRCVQAMTIYKNEPVKFYKWWLKNQDKIYLKKVELIKLIDSIKRINPGVLSAKHARL